MTTNTARPASPRLGWRAERASVLGPTSIARTEPPSRAAGPTRPSTRGTGPGSRHETRSGRRSTRPERRTPGPVSCRVPSIRGSRSGRGACRFSTDGDGSASPPTSPPGGRARQPPPRSAPPAASCSRALASRKSTSDSGGCPDCTRDRRASGALGRGLDSAAAPACGLPTARPRLNGHCPSAAAARSPGMRFPQVLGPRGARTPGTRPGDAPDAPVRPLHRP